MTASETRRRREPPPFRRVRVARIEARTPRLRRITLTGDELDGFEVGSPAASIRLLPPTQGGELVLPTWNGNEFLFDDGSRPPIRTLTPLRFAPDTRALDVEVVLHGEGPLSSWAASAAPGDAAAVSGTGRGYEVDPNGRAFVLAGDESALPAITTVIPALPDAATVTVLVEIDHADARVALPGHPALHERWVERSSGRAPGDALVEAVTALDVDRDTYVWAAGEAAAMQRIRRHLFETVGLPRHRAVVRGYWKRGRRGDAGD